VQKDFLEGFSKEGKLGKGGFSTVWSAVEHKTNKRYAIKEIHGLNQFQTHLAEISFSNRFFYEGKIRE
jgi:serine/threonine protein kinase